MQRLILKLFFLGLLNIQILGQGEPATAPVKWEYYKISEKNVAVLFPKMPVLISTGDQCREEESRQYAAYANEAVYVLNVTSKISADIKNFCSNQRAFGERNLLDRLDAVKNQLKVTDETRLKIKGLNVIKVQGGGAAYWFFNDLKNNRWYELWIIGADESKPEAKNFIESIRFEKTDRGNEIGEGAPRTLGDDKIAKEKSDEPTENKTNGNSSGTGTTGVRVVLKPRPSYTDVARKNQTAGTTRLRITFLASGGIGSVTPVTTLPYGLTEQAIAAARKIVFIPAKINNKPVTVSKLVEYSFTIY